MTDLETQIRQLMSKYRVPGVAVGMLQDGLETYVCEGATSVFNPLEVTQNGEAMKKYREEMGIEIH